MEEEQLAVLETELKEVNDKLCKMQIIEADTQKKYDEKFEKITQRAKLLKNHGLNMTPLSGDFD